MTNISDRISKDYLWSACDHFACSAVTLLVGRQKGHEACKMLGVGLLVMMLQLSPLPPSFLAPVKSRMVTKATACLCVSLQTSYMTSYSG